MSTSQQPGLSYKEIADAIVSFFYQSRHPQVRAYIANVVSALSGEVHAGKLRRMTMVIKGVADGLPRERMVFDLGYLAEIDKLREGRNADVGLIGAPNADELGLMLRGFLIKLNALDGQLLDIKDETTFAIIVETNDSLEPLSNSAEDGSIPPWVPALANDTLQPPSSQDLESGICPEKHEPLLNVKAVETGVIDSPVMFSFRVFSSVILSYAIDFDFLYLK
ncbi:mitotic spindle assembly checkpoint protein MAD2B [Kwoniella heveanensis CBS 569]|nr:mitotic spindle assembly checkpoint protein MAD2B [Kwoniella heveanensis CBS 569]